MRFAIAWSRPSNNGLSVHRAAAHLVNVRAVALIALTIGCAPERSTAGAGTWIGTTTTERKVTTVVTESGSVWSGDATLVEELAIGVESGPEEYMFGEIASVFADDSSIYVVDEQAPAVRVYDLKGRYLRDLGRAGEGPGEYRRPWLVARRPDGRVLVADRGTRRILVYRVDGVSTDEVYPMGSGVAFGSWPLHVDDHGRPWLPYREYDILDPAARRSPRFSVRPHDHEGPTGDPVMIPEFPVEGVSSSGGAGRFGPRMVWDMSASGTMLLGTSDRYRFERREPDGNRTVVKKNWDRVPVHEQEAAYFRRLSTVFERPAPPMPDAKPAFLALLGAPTGETWVLRQGPGIKIPDCNDRPESAEQALAADPCWQDSLFFDVFDGAGRFLGRIDLPEEMRDPMSRWALRPHFERDRVNAIVMDDAGTLRVKRYRLATPG